MSGYLACISHTPLIGLVDPSAAILGEIDDFIQGTRQEIAKFDPELVILFAPDHFNGFFHDVMPSFCVGMEASAIGDFNTPKGALSTEPELAMRLAEYCMDHDVDIATSLQMQVDHGFAQPLDFLLGGLAKYPIIPVFVNCIAPPLPTFKRARILGETVGNFCKTLNKRVLFMASGGLSHQPPVPQYATANDDVRHVLLGAGKNLSPADREARRDRTIKAAKSFVLNQATLHALAPEWDQKFLDTIASNSMSSLDTVKAEEVTEIAGASTHEVKTWVVAASAMSMIKPYHVSRRYYRPIPEWIAGFGGIVATSIKE